MSHRTLPGISLQPATPTDCRHSRAGFHCCFGSIAERGDLSDAAKLLHAALVSMVRQQYAWTQGKIAEVLGWGCRQKVWRAANELVTAGLLTVKRLGLGRPNEYTLAPTDDITPEDIAARAPRDRGGKAGHPEGRPRNAHARAFISSKKNDERSRYSGSRYKDFDASNYFETSTGDLICRG